MTIESGTRVYTKCLPTHEADLYLNLLTTLQKLGLFSAEFYDVYSVNRSDDSLKRNYSYSKSIRRKLRWIRVVDRG